jgi:chorismate-pyruvate lyase
LFAACAGSFVHAQAPSSPTDAFTAQVEALAAIQTLNAELLSSRSATLTLETWCRDHHLADPPKIVAHQTANTQKPPTAEQRQRLEVAGDEAVRYRHVQLACGTRVLSEADNWYVPRRLTGEMNRILETTETPFGRAVQALEPYRRTFTIALLWAPIASPHQAAPPDGVLLHRAVLYTKDHKPFSEVSEVYQREILAFLPELTR